MRAVLQLVQEKPHPQAQTSVRGKPAVCEAQSGRERDVSDALRRTNTGLGSFDPPEPRGMTRKPEFCLTISPLRGRPDAVEKNEDEEKDEDDCLICFDQPRTVCMVPCGHLLLCDACVAEKILGQRRLFECPLCRAELQFPFVMQREEWASLGHPVYE